MENLDNEGLGEHGPEIIKEYSPDTLAILEQLGEDRLGALQAAIADHSKTEDVPDVIDTIENMVSKHQLKPGAVELSKLGYPTIADSLCEMPASKKAMNALERGKATILKSVGSHHMRARQVAAAHDRAMLRELGIAGTATIYVDEPTNLHLVHLATPEHCRYEGVSLVHCLGNLATARAYLERDDVLLYSLREGGTEPRVTIEVNARKLAVIQARQRKDQPLHEDSGEYHALGRALVPLSTHVAPGSPTQLTITDSIIRR